MVWIGGDGEVGRMMWIGGHGGDRKMWMVEWIGLYGYVVRVNQDGNEVGIVE